jgi:RNA recognition motif-containing protein
LTAQAVHGNACRATHNLPAAMSSLKRNASIAEIEVDLKQPEPPSKKARRLLKKGKALPPKPNSDDEIEDKGGAQKPSKTGDDGEDVPAVKKKERSPYCVWIGNLPFTTTRKDLREWLVTNSAGVIAEEAITRIQIPRQAKPGHAGSTRKTRLAKQGDAALDEKEEKLPNKGFAYVDFATEAAHAAALALSETLMSGRRLLIKDSKNFEGRPEKPAEPEPVSADGTSNSPQATLTGSRKVFVGNLSFETTENDVWRHFSKCGQIDWVKIATFEDTGKCKGFGWVNFHEPSAAIWAVKGFVKIKEEVEAESDDEDSPADEDGEDADVLKKNRKRWKPTDKPQTRTRKWWVNMLHGRTLKIEIAEDDGVRYKKRFGKDALRRKEEEQQRSDSAAEKAKEAVAEQRTKSSKQDIMAARLMGTAVASQGVKTSLE